MTRRVSRSEVRLEAERRGWLFERLAGELGLIRRLLEGDWDDDFLVLAPGQRLAMSYDARRGASARTSRPRGSPTVSASPGDPGAGAGVAELIHENDRRPLRSAGPSSTRPTSWRAGSLLVPPHRALPRVRRAGHEGAESLSSRTEAEAFLPHGFRLACQAVVERDDRDVRFAVLRRRLRILMPSEPETRSHGSRSTRS